jgi:hypothetical protein
MFRSWSFILTRVPSLNLRAESFSALRPMTTGMLSSFGITDMNHLTVRLTKSEVGLFASIAFRSTERNLPVNSEAHVLDIPDPSGHLSLTWNIDDPASVATAEAEFNRLKAAGYTFYTTDGREIARLTLPSVLEEQNVLDIRIAKQFEPKAKRTVAMRPMKGG